MSLRRLCRLLICAGWLAAACGPAPTPTPTPTSPPTLNVSLWVDYPVIPVTYPQAVNVTVNDQVGRPVTDAIVVGIYETSEGLKTIYFPHTDSSGQTRIPLDMPAVAYKQTFAITVSVASGQYWGRARTTFDVYP